MSCPTSPPSPALSGVLALQKSIDRMLTEATARLSIGKTVEAGRSYEKASQFAEQLAETMPDPAQAETMRLRAAEFLVRARSLAKGRHDPKRCRPFEQNEADDQVLTDEDNDRLEQQIMLLIDDRPRNIGWDSIGGMEDLKTELRFHYGLAMAKVPEGVQVEGWQNVMFYGPPGTGKTLLACAIASKLQATFFNVKASQVVSKWVGESGRLIGTLYRLARKFTADGRPSIVFIDEFDALCKARGTDGAQLHHQQMLSAILSEIDGFANKGRRNMVMTIGATNRPWDLDAAVLSRFERRIHIALPDEAARGQVFRIHLADKGIEIDRGSIGYDELARLSERLSGREIARVCKDVTAGMLTEMNPDIPALVDQGLDAIQAYTVRFRPLTRDDFLRTLRRTTPDAAVAEIDQFERWGGHGLATINGHAGVIEV